MAVNDYVDAPPDSASSRPRYQRSNSTPWVQKAPSVESLHQHPYPKVLKKRHSTYSLSNPVPDRPLFTPPVPELPPQRPPRHPARTGSTIVEMQRKPKRSSRPNTATGSRESITPWEHLPTPAEEGQSTQSRSAAPSVKSRASSTGMALSKSTGPVEEVTPWELYPVPKSTKASPYLDNHIPLSATPLKSAPSTGPVEDVTPWELQPGPTPAPKPDSLSPRLPPVPPLSPSRRSLPHSDHSSHQHHQPQVRPVPTGPKEEVTPWEVQPGPAEGQELEVPDFTDAAPRKSLSLSMAQLEEVTPWELYPAPKANGNSLHNEGQAPVSTTRPSTSSNSTKTLSELGLRRRRSTGSKPAKGRASIQAAAALNASKQPVASTSAMAQQKGISSNASGTANPAPPPPTHSPPTPSTTPTAFTHAHTHTSPSHQKHKQSAHAQEQQDLKFSTADRTILEQLKVNIRAREEQFVIKGFGSTVVGGERSAGKRHHAYARGEVPYPRSYEREVIDLDVWETMFCLDICESLTWHVFEEPPTKVLEIGCGTGTWLLQCAQTWKDCHFVGLDIVPLHPNLQNVGSPDLASRITWVQHNFLDGLPFQNEEFDFVHIKRIALGVPEDKWDALFEEISRVMKPGGAFEMVEEDLFFPGKRADDDNDDDESIKDDDTSSLTRRNSVSSYRFRRGSVNGNHIMHDDDESEDGSPLTPTTNATLQHTSSRSSSPGRRGKDEGRKADVVIVEDEHRTFVDSAALLNASGNPPAASTSSVALVWPHSRSSARPALSVKTKEHHESGLGIAVPTVFGSSISLLGSMGYVVHQQDPGLDALVQRARSSTQTSNTSNGSGRGPATTSTSSHMQSPGASSDGHGGGVKKTKPSPFLLRSLTKAPNNNPRDHTLLEAIWNAMLASRFVNTSPLSLLTGYLEYHFKDVRTHPPLLYTFPPAAPKPEAEDSDDEKQGVSDSDPDLDEARDAIVPRPQRPRSMKSKKSTTSNAPFSDENGELTEEHRWLSMKALLKHSSPYVKIDGSRSYAYSPSNKASFPIPKTKDGKPGATRRASRLPNTTLHIDLRTLNLHLALRAKEVIACSESMWEWVQEYQEKATEEPKMARTRAGSLATSMFAGHPGDSSSSLDLTKNTILEMTRDDFDQILNNFEMDMQDQASVGHALKERFNWHTFPSEILKDRKLFNQACRKYDKWVLEQQRLKSSYHPYPQSASKHHHRSGNSFSNPSIIPPTPDTVTSHESVIARSISSPQPGSERVVVDEPGANVSPTLHRHDPAVHFAPLSSPTSHHSMQSMPTQRLSRAMRVFVGWKAPSS